MQTIPTAKIYPGARARPLVKSNVDRLAASIGELGLLNPIIVKPSRRFHGGVERDVFDIVAGCHRFEAARQLGWTEVECKLIEHVDDLHVELAEIDENLVRAGLSPAQEAGAMSRRKELYEALHPETANGATGGGHNQLRQNGEAASRFTKATSEAIGKSERSIQRAAARGEALGDDLERVKGTSLDRSGELDALAQMPAEERAPLIERAQAGEVVSARRPFKIAADPLQDAQASEKQVARLMDAWNAAGPEARQEFMLRIEQPIMDRRFG